MCPSGQPPARGRQPLRGGVPAASRGRLNALHRGVCTAAAGSHLLQQVLSHSAERSHAGSAARAARGRLRRSTRDARVCRSARGAGAYAARRRGAPGQLCLGSSSRGDGLGARPVNSPWRGQVYQRDAEEEARLDDKLSAAKAAAEARAAKPLTETETYWRKREEPGAGDLCHARAVDAFRGRGATEMGLAQGDRVLVVKDELLPGRAGSSRRAMVTRGTCLGTTSWKRWRRSRKAELVKTYTLTVDSDAPLRLSPMDWANRGRAIPCTWFFAHALPPQKLVDALRDTRAADCASSLAASVDGVDAHAGMGPRARRLRKYRRRRSTALLKDAYVLRPAKQRSDAPRTRPMPLKAGMDPDDGRATTPLLEIRITLFDHGTAVGVLDAAFR